MANDTEDSDSDYFQLLSDSDLEMWTNRLLAGETGEDAEAMSRAIIIDFTLRAALSRPQSDFTIQWLAHGLDQMLDYADPYAALTLARRAPHRPAADHRIQTVLLRKHIAGTELPFEELLPRRPIGNVRLHPAPFRVAPARVGSCFCRPFRSAAGWRSRRPRAAR